MELPATLSENLQRGLEAMERVIIEHIDVPNAMYRDDVGWITSDWGEPGDEQKEYKNGYGVSHIIARRNFEGENGEETARSVVGVIAEGRLDRTYGPPDARRVNVIKDDMVAVLALHRFGYGETWLLTGFRKDGDRGSGGTGGGFDPADPTHERATRTRPNVGAKPAAPKPTKI